MILKFRTCLMAVKRGVETAVIFDKAVHEK